jgi:D-inositol-3-phosphate glycosyltransferase
MQRVAVISMHTSPLAQPGVGDGGGMNVYVRELVSAMAQKSMQCTTYTRAWREGLPKVVEVEPNHKIVHIESLSFYLSNKYIQANFQRYFSNKHHPYYFFLK